MRPERRLSGRNGGAAPAAPKVRLASSRHDLTTSLANNPTISPVESTKKTYPSGSSSWSPDAAVIGCSVPSLKKTMNLFSAIAASLQEQPFWRKGDKSRGAGGSAPNQKRRDTASWQCSSVLLELRRRHITESGVEASPVVNLFQKLC